MPIQFRNSQILFTEDSKIAMDPACCCDCPSTLCNDGVHRIVTQVAFEMDLPDQWDVWITELDPNTGEPSAYVRQRFTGLNVFDGTFTANRAAAPDCSWTVPTQTENISWEKRRWGAFGCPSGDGNFESSGTASVSVVFPNSNPVNHQIKFDGIAGLSYSPDPHSPCALSSIEATEAGLDGCISPTTHTSTAQSTAS